MSSQGPGAGLPLPSAAPAASPPARAPARGASRAARPASSARGREARCGPRHTLAAALALDAGDGLSPLAVTDVSDGGLGVRLPAGRRLPARPLRLRLDDGRGPAEIVARVAWSAASGRHGLVVLDALMCTACDRGGTLFDAPERARVASNVRRWRAERFTVWRCRHCRSLHCLEDVDLDRYYEGYPLQRQRVDVALAAAHAIRRRRLERAGLQAHHRILDYGCGTGHFVDHLRARGYRRIAGYDRYVARFQDPAVLSEQYDFVVSQDFIEHVADPAGELLRLAALLVPGGVLCVGTPDADRIALDSPIDCGAALHQPYHRHLLSRTALTALAARAGLRPIRHYDRWYYASLLPGCNGPFLYAYLAAAGDLDAGFERFRPQLLLRSPRLLALFVLGRFARDNQMTVLFRRG